MIACLENIVGENDILCSVTVQFICYNRKLKTNIIVALLTMCLRYSGFVEQIIA